MTCIHCGKPATEEDSLMMPSIEPDGQETYVHTKCNNDYESRLTYGQRVQLVALIANEMFCVCGSEFSTENYVADALEIVKAAEKACK